MSIDDTPYGDRVNATSAEMVELPLRLRKSQLGFLEQARAECDLTSVTSVLHQAIQLFLWALREVKQGRRIASYDEVTERLEMVHIPAFSAFPSNQLRSEHLVTETAAVTPWWKRFWGRG